MTIIEDAIKSHKERQPESVEGTVNGHSVVLHKRHGILGWRLEVPINGSQETVVRGTRESIHTDFIYMKDQHDLQ